VESSLQGISSNLFVVETKQYVSSNANVILTRQTCGQRSKMSAESKRRKAQICFTSEFAMCSTYQNVETTKIYVSALFDYLQKENRCAMPNSEFSRRRNKFFLGSRHCVPCLFVCQVPKKCTELDLSPLYILIYRTYSKFARNNNF